MSDHEPPAGDPAAGKANPAEGVSAVEDDATARPQFDPELGFRAHEWVVEPRLRRLIRGAERRQVEPRSMDVLVDLTRRPGEVVSKHDLLDRVWGGIAVSPNVLSYSVATLRKALDDDWRSPRFIETISKGGYRWIAPMEPLTSAPSGRARAADVLRGRLASILAVAGVALTLILAVALARSGAPDAPAPALHARPLTSAPGWEVDPSVSADGARVVFAHRDPQGDQYDLYLLDLGEDTPAQITDTETVSERRPAFSPDGAHLAFVGSDSSGCAIYRLPLLGGSAERLAGCARGPLGNLAWSPDGQTIAFDDRDQADQPRRIHLLDIATGTVRALTDPASTDSGDRRPAFSPDGRQIAFQRIRGDGLADLYLIDAAGGSPRRLTFDARDIGGHDWSPDGRELIFSSYRAGQFTLWRVGVDGGSPPRSVAINDHQIGSLQAIANGSIIYSKLSYDATIISGRAERRDGGPAAAAAARAAGTGPSYPRSDVAPRGREERLIHSTRWELHPQISPDRKRIVFTSDRSGSFEIWSCAADGTDLIRHTHFDGPFVGTPRWSPDGQSIVFDARPEGHADLWITQVRGGSPRRITTDLSDEFAASFSADGAWIYFSSNRDQAWNVWRMPAAGGEPERLATEGAYAALEGPEARYLYFTRYGVPGLWRWPLEDGPIEQIDDSLLIADWGNWVIANGGVYFVARAPTPALRFYDPGDRQTREVFPLPASVAYNHPALAVSDDGTWFLVGITEGSHAELMIADRPSP